MEVRGKLNYFIYPKNGQTSNDGFTVFKLNEFNTKKNITVVGYSKSLSIGLNVKVQGEMKNHPKYGEQIEAKSIEVIIPAKKEKIIKILTENIDGIGVKTAEKIYNQFGDETLSILRKTPEKIRILKLGNKEDKIINSLNVFFKNKSNIIDLSMRLGISLGLSEKINNSFTEEAHKIIEKNPYKLINKIDGFGFKRADEVAKYLGFQSTSYNRIQEGIKYCLRQSLKDGDLFLYKDELINRVIKLLGLNKRYLKKISSVIDNCKDIIKDDDRIYMEKLYYIERIVAEKLKEISKVKKINSNITLKEIKRKINKIEKDMDILFSKKQREAIILTIHNKVSIITGGPGTGKTTITKAIIKIYNEIYGSGILLTAPTGKAAKKLKEATGFEAQTIHRLLEASIIDGKMYFKKNNYNKLRGKLLIIDESSMIDIFLMKDLLQAVPAHMSIVFLGDIDQLPSIGPGNVLKSLIDSKKIPLVKLDTVYRQKEKSLTTINSYRINNGKGIIKKVRGGYINDFICLLCNNDEEIMEKMKKLIEEKLLKYKTINPIKDIQVLTPMKKGILGADNLNLILRNILNDRNSKKNEIKYHGVLYREGDKIIQTDNNYKKNVFNGDTGIIKSINLVNSSITAVFGEGSHQRKIVYSKKEIMEIMPSYAITVHKSQGSEYPIIIVPITKSHTIMLNRSMLYTALTRAKKLAIIIAEEEALDYCIKNNRIKKRNTNLDGLIKDIFMEGRDFKMGINSI